MFFENTVEVLLVRWPINDSNEERLGFREKNFHPDGFNVFMFEVIAIIEGQVMSDVDRHSPAATISISTNTGVSWNVDLCHSDRAIKPRFAESYDSGIVRYSQISEF